MQYPKRTIGSIETLRLNRADFKKVIADNIVLISRAFRKQFVSKFVFYFLSRYICSGACLLI